MSEAIIDVHDLAKCVSGSETNKTNLQIAEELYKSRGKVFCVGLIIHLIMYVTGGCSAENPKS